MKWSGRFSPIIAVVLGITAFPVSSPAFQLSPEDEAAAAQDKAGNSQTSAMPVMVSGVSPPEPVVEKPAGGLPQARNARRRAEATAPPIRLLPGTPSPGGSPSLSPTTVISSAAVTSSLVDAGAPNLISGSGVASITKVRLGQHSDKTRIVLDASGKVDFTYKIGEAKTAVIINFPQIDWRPAQSSKRPAGLVAGYSFDKGILDIKTRIPVNVQKVFVLPSANGAGYRIVLDLTDVRAPGSDKP